MSIQPNTSDHQTHRNPAIFAMGAEALTMSSREIADLCDKRHDHVMRDITKMLEELGEDAPKFGGIYLDAYGREKPQMCLPKDLTLTLVAGYNVKLRKRIIDRWMELESQLAAPDPMKLLSDPAAMRGLLLTYSERVLALEGQVANLAEKEEALDRISTADGSMCITDAAKALQMRPKDLFAWLSQNGWIYKRTGAAHYLGYQSKTTAGLVEHKVTTVLRTDGTEKVTEQVRITSKGLTTLAKLIKPSARAT